MLSLLEHYQHQIASGRLRPDEGQARAVQALQNLLSQLQPASLSAPSKRLLAGFGRSARPNWTQPTPKGLYLYGDVGRGKSMLMDLFYAAATISKRRVHFHEFMQEIHSTLHQLRTKEAETQDPLPKLAQKLAAKHRLLCFDEFQVTDIADAMIMARLFGALFAAGIILVTTSNSAPQALYAGGLQRERFLPFIKLLEQHLEILPVDGGTDYRLQAMHGEMLYFSPVNPAHSQKLADIFAQLTGNATPQPVALAVQGRSLNLKRMAKQVLWTDFKELCQQPLGAADYLAIAGQCRAVILDGVPQFHADQRNETMRFITLIDALYEAKIQLAMAAQTTVTELYPAGLHALMFARTASRLQQMTQAGWGQSGV
jgi:cell division protein ZapE